MLPVLFCLGMSLLFLLTSHSRAGMRSLIWDCVLHRFPYQSPDSANHRPSIL